MINKVGDEIAKMEKGLVVLNESKIASINVYT